MAQTGFTPIQIYSSSTAAAAPVAGNLTNSTLGSELAINITDGKLFYKDNANAIQVIGWKTVPTTAGGTGLTSYTAGDLIYYSTGTTFTKLAIGSAYQALQVNAGGTAPSWQPSASSVMTAQGDLLYASAANTLARLAKNTTATRYLSNTGTNNDPAWAQINLANGVTGTLPIANGGTNSTATPTNGAVAFGNGTAFAFTAAGTSGQVLTSVGAGTPVWKDAPASGPAFSVFRSGNQTITSGVYTKVQLNAETFDTNNNFDPTTNYRFTPTIAGYYQINGKISATGSTASTSMASAIYKNGSIYKYGPYVQTTAAESNVQDVVYFNGTTDYVELFVYITATTAVIGGGSENTYFSGVLVRAA